LIGNRPQSATFHTATVMGNHTSRANDGFKSLTADVFISGGQFYAEDFSSFGRLDFREKSKTLADILAGPDRDFFISTETFKTARQTVSRGLTVLFFISGGEFHRQTKSTTTFESDLTDYWRLKKLDKNMDEKKWLAHNKNYMSIAVSVLTTSRVARNNGGVARQESNPQSATAYSSVRCVQL